MRNGHIKRITDNDIQSSVLEIMSTNISTTFVSCPADSAKTLGIKLPFLVMIIKNVRRRPPQSPPNNQHPATVVGRHPVNNKQLAREGEWGLSLTVLSDYGVWKRLYARGAV